MEQQPVRPTMDEARAHELAWEAIEKAGGSRMIYRSPRHPFTLFPSTTYDIDGVSVEVRHGEISSPAIVSVAGYVYEIHETDIELLARPPKPRPRNP